MALASLLALPAAGLANMACTKKAESTATHPTAFLIHSTRAVFACLPNSYQILAAQLKLGNDLDCLLGGPLTEVADGRRAAP